MTCKKLARIRRGKVWGGRTILLGYSHTYSRVALCYSFHSFIQSTVGQRSWSSFCYYMLAELAASYHPPLPTYLARAGNDSKQVFGYLYANFLPVFPAILHGIKLTLYTWDNKVKTKSVLFLINRFQHTFSSETHCPFICTMPLFYSNFETDNPCLMGLAGLTLNALLC